MGRAREIEIEIETETETGTGTDTDTGTASQPRTESGAQRIDLPTNVNANDINTTKQHPKVVLPLEALRSTPPPPDSEKAAPAGTAANATSMMSVPESVKLLRLAIPTPCVEISQAELAAISFPTAPLPEIEVAPATPLPAKPFTTTQRKKLKRKRSIREIANAVILFGFLMLVVGVAARLIVLGFFQ